MKKTNVVLGARLGAQPISNTFLPDCVRYAMRRICSLFVSIVFLGWIMPLGSWIQPAQESVACNGQRAVCMCSHAKAAPAAAQPGPAVYKAGGAARGEPGGSASARQYLHAIELGAFFGAQAGHLFTRDFQPALLFVARPIEHIPKIAL